MMAQHFIVIVAGLAYTQADMLWKGSDHLVCLNGNRGITFHGMQQLWLNPIINGSIG